MTPEEKKIARQISVQKYNEKNKEKQKAYYQENKERIKKENELKKDSKKEYNENYYKTNSEREKQRVKKYREENPDLVKQYRDNNKDKRNQWEQNKRKTDMLFRLKGNIKSLIRGSIKRYGYIKNSKSLDILGCSFEEFKLYLENKFEPWMTWDNYGLYNGELSYGWDIDHIVPLSIATTEEEILKLNNYTNLQPLCSYVNRNIKRDKVD